MSVPEPPYKTAISTSFGGELHVTEDFDSVSGLIEAAYESTSPFIRVTDNYGRPLMLPVGTILLVSTPN